MVADSCHSGTLHLAPPPDDDEFSGLTGLGPFRTISIGTSQRHRREYGVFYRNTLVPLTSTIEATILLLAACAPDGKTLDGVPNGVYTAALLKVLKESKVKDYDDLVNQITDELRAQGLKQIPQIHTGGQPSDFRKEKPFKI